MATKVSARERARLAKAERDAKRIQQEKAVMAETQNYYTAEDAVEAARQAMAQAEQERAAAVAALAELGETVADIATLCGISASDVRALKKIARSPATEPKETTAAKKPTESEGDAAQDTAA